MRRKREREREREKEQRQSDELPRQDIDNCDTQWHARLCISFKLATTCQLHNSCTLCCMCMGWSSVHVCSCAAWIVLHVCCMCAACMCAACMCAACVIVCAACARLMSSVRQVHGHAHAHDRLCTSCDVIACALLVSCTMDPTRPPIAPSTATLTSTHTPHTLAHALYQRLNRLFEEDTEM